MSTFEQIANNSKKSTALLLFISVAFFIGLGNVHLFDWDEINFAESAREMITSGDYLRVQINFAPFWEKPPLFLWLQVGSMKLFGINEFAARFPNAVFGFIYLITFYFIGKKHFSGKFGLMWALIFYATLLPHIYFKSGIIDPVFNYCIFLSVYFMIRVINGNDKKKGGLALVSGVLSGLSVLTKGPVGFLLLALTLLIYLTIKKFKPFPKVKYIGFFFIGFISIILSWLSVEIFNNGFTIIQKFIVYQAELFNSNVAGHEQPFYYHFVVVFLGCFPISILALPSLMKRRWDITLDLHSWMLCLFWGVLILFSLVTTKIIHYSSMTWAPLSFIAALTLYKVSKGEYEFKKSLRIAFLGLGLLIGSAIIAIPLLLINKEWLLSITTNQYAHDSIAQPIQWSYFEVVSGFMFIIGTIVCFLFLHKQKIATFIVSAALFMTAVLLSVQLMIIPKIEQITQGPAIDFFEKLRGKDCYVECYGFKSYAHYFYFQQPHDQTPEQKTMNWLVNGNIDKPVYLITKSDNNEVAQWEQFRLLMKKGGFRVYKRELDSKQMPTP
ncbi:glycosyltransferase family 39 protein [Crocinitomicaceae bacterium]|nr:glycosyltransferase family 39 protein [Crocinitomicaceae bacterium]